MSNPKPQSVSISVDSGRKVSGLLQTASGAGALYVVAHGAGAGMTHPFMASVADGLAARRIGTLRYQFPYMEQGSKRPDSPKIAYMTVRAAVAEASGLAPELPLFAGGKSFGGRMTSQAQAESPLRGVRGLIFLGFPLHPPNRPSEERGEHLLDVQVPMLFLQGTRDALANLELVESLAAKLGPRATLKLFQNADHSFHVPASTGRNDAEIRGEMMQTIAQWMEGIVSGRLDPGTRSANLQHSNVS